MGNTLMKTRNLITSRIQKTIFLALMVICVLSISPTISLLMNSIIIENTGEIISATTVIARSGSAVDIQAAVNAVAALGGGTVHIPAGTYHWNGETVTIPGGVNVKGTGLAGCDGHPTFTQYSAQTILHNDVAAYGSNPMFYVNGINGRQVTILGIQFEATPPPTVDDSNGGIAVSIYRAIDFRVGYCTFIDFSGEAVMASDSDTGNVRGVLDHCIATNPYKLVTGGGNAVAFYVAGKATWWNDATAPITSFLGKYDTIPSGYPVLYVEDCHMSYWRHSVDAIQGGWIVARYNYVDHPFPVNYGELDIHGSEGGSWPSGRGFEFYNNVVVGAPEDYARTAQIWLRGGGGMVYGNTFLKVATMSGYYAAITLALETCPPQPQEVLHNVWIWGNTIDEGTLVLNGSGASFVENVDYFLRAPSLVSDGFTYTPYTYPHPLTLETIP